MRILYYFRSRKLEVEKEFGVEFRLFEDLLRESDFVVLVVLLIKEI